MDMGQYIGNDNGPVWCCAAGRDGADLWKSIWQILGELSETSVVKAKAHLTFSQVIDGTISCGNWVGNGIADKWAKAGCDEAGRSAPCARVQREWITAVAWYRWLIRMSSDWKCDTASSAPLLPPTSRRDSEHPRVAEKPDPVASHELSRSADKAWCRKCGIFARLGRSWPPATLRRLCRGTMGERCSIEGREVARPSVQGNPDDGAISLATLSAFGAQRLDFPPTAPNVHVSQLRPARGNTAADGDASPVAAVQGVYASLPMFDSREEEDDPFGFADLGFDNETSLTPSSTSAHSTAHTLVGPAEALPVAPASRLAGAHGSHTICKTGHVIWCRRCGRHAAVRLGVGLLKPCVGKAEGAYPARLVSLRDGRHPISGDPL